MAHPILDRWRAIFGLRCPRCRRGPIFRTRWSAYDRCPDCGLIYVREPGYFVGSMYFSYGLGIPITLMFTSIAYLLLPHRHLYEHVLIAWAAMLPLVPWIYRLSRSLWLHFDRYFDPDEHDAPPPGV